MKKDEMVEQKRQEVLREKQREFEERKDDVNYYTCITTCTLQDVEYGLPMQCSSKRDGRNEPTIIRVKGELSERMTKSGLRRPNDANTKTAAKFGLLSSPTDAEKLRSIAITLSEDLMCAEMEPRYFYEALRRTTINTESGIVAFEEGDVLANPKKLPGRFVAGSFPAFQFIGHGRDRNVAEVSRKRISHITSTEVSYDDRDDLGKAQELVPEGVG